MGMSLTVASGLSNSVMAWITTKTPAMGTLVARKEYRQLDQLFFTALRRCVMLCTTGSAAVWLGVLYLDHLGNPLGQRLLAPPQFALLLGASLANLVGSALGIYLRSHKQEPFLVLSIVTGALTGASTLCLVWWFGVTAMLAGYFAITLLGGLGWGSFIFLRKRRLWHQSLPQTNILE
jgi:O-antigen/teichoic acid export membrane protein